MAVAEHAVHYLEIVTAEVEAVRELYENTCGWRFQPLAPELGNAAVAERPGGSLCGIRAPLQPQEHPVVRIYVRVNDLKATLQRAEQSGAEIMLPHMEIPGRGSIAIYRQGGIEHGIWQVA